VNPWTLLKFIGKNDLEREGLTFILQKQQSIFGKDLTLTSRIFHVVDFEMQKIPPSCWMPSLGLVDPQHLRAFVDVAVLTSFFAKYTPSFKQEIIGKLNVA